MSSSATVVARYTQTQNIDEPLAEVRSGGNNYYEADALGSITSLSSATGTVANTYTYDSFGNVTNSTGTLSNPFRYTGREFDPETGLDYYRARYYEPNNGRFASEDPLKFIGGIDFYAYVGNSPIIWTDPRGLCPRKKCPAVPEAPPGVSVNWNIRVSRWMRPVTYTDPLLSLYLFKKTVGNKMPWDYKQYGWTMTDTGQLGSSPFQDFGNFNYGAAGAAWGIPLNVLQRAAGYAQDAAGTSTPEWGHWYQGPPYGDDPEDQILIIEGYEYYTNGCFE